MKRTIGYGVVAALLAGALRMAVSALVVGYVPTDDMMFRAGYYTVMSTLQLITFVCVWAIVANFHRRIV